MTLLEVLFSIGIAAVGLLGVLILVPLAGLRATQGTIADGADRMGRNAIRAFDVYQMRRPDAWAQLNPTDANSSSFLTYPSPFSAPFNPGEAFCIDPMYISEHDATPGTWGIFRFPYFATTYPTPPPSNLPLMRRITLRSYPGAAVSPPSMMLDRQPAQVFLGDDDLVFSLPPDRTLPPEQRYDSAGLKRQWEGKFSWLATLVPKPGFSSDMYMLSLVVFHRRDLTVDAERIVDVTSFDSQGMNGGEVVLSALPSGSTTTPATKDDLRMREGEWLMLAGMNTTTAQTHFRWYRIQAAGADPYEDTSVTPSVWRRDLTLFGQDWPQSALTVNKAVWSPGVVAVYEKTIRLETSSLWTDL